MKCFSYSGANSTVHYELALPWDYFVQIAKFNEYPFDFLKQSEMYCEMIYTVMW